MSTQTEMGKKPNLKPFHCVDLHEVVALQFFDTSFLNISNFTDLSAILTAQRSIFYEAACIQLRASA